MAPSAHQSTAVGTCAHALYPLPTPPWLITRANPFLLITAEAKQLGSSSADVQLTVEEPQDGEQLFTAALLGSATKVKALLEAGYPINLPDAANSRTPLIKVLRVIA